MFLNFFQTPYTAPFYTANLILNEVTYFSTKNTHTFWYLTLKYIYIIAKNVQKYHRPYYWEHSP